MEDRALVVAVQMERADQCDTCGLSEREWALDPTAFTPMQVVCPWCALRDRARSDSDTDRSIPGASVKLISSAAAARIADSPARRPESARERKGLR